MNHQSKKEKYDRIGLSYNSTRQADPYLASRLFHYLDPQVRRGISSFSDLSRRVEVENGLRQLGKDIYSGKIKDIMKAYEKMTRAIIYSLLPKKPIDD